MPFTSPEGGTEHALRVWELILRSTTNQDLDSSNPPKAISLIPSLIGYPESTRTWKLLVQATATGNGEAKKTLENVLYLLHAFDVSPKFVNAEREDFQWLDTPDANLKIQDLIFRALDLRIQDYHLVPVPEDCVYACNRAWGKILEKRQETFRAFIRLVAWFAAYEEHFQNMASEFWSDLCSGANVTHWLNPQGRDVISLNIPALRNHGHKYIQLMPFGEYPAAKARRWVYLGPIGVRLHITDELVPGSIEASNQELDRDYLDSVICRMYKFISLQCLWRIATGQPFSKKAPHLAKNETGEARREDLERKFLMRPHFRRLPPGHNVSERAVERSVTQWKVQPPPQKTFVMSDVEAQVVIHGPERSIFAYTAEDLGYTE